MNAWIITAVFLIGCLMGMFAIIAAGVRNISANSNAQADEVAE